MIVQLLPPGGGGVRDYAQGLGQAWLEAGVPCRYIDGRRDDPVRLSTRLAPDNFEAPLRLVVHFSGYGYGERGLCQWLVDELRATRAAWNGRDRVLVVFHELFAGGRPWQSAFWLSPIQERIARRMALLADRLWTNTEHHGAWLRRQRPDLSVTIQPVFSNVGEHGAGPGWTQRERRALVFGGHGTRLRALQALKGREGRLHAWGIDELVHIGNGPDIEIPLDIPQRHLRRLEGEALTAQLHAARFGLLDYPSRYLGKSGVFAAYAAHGCLTIDTHPERHTVDGLVEGCHYATLDRAAPPPEDQRAAMGAQAEAWYRPHARETQARAMLELLTAR